MSRKMQHEKQNGAEGVKMRRIIIRNAIRCKNCGDVIESTYRYEFVTCSCGNGAGHHVYMEKGAGVGSGFSDDEYMHAGASLIDNAADVWHLVDMMVKVKEPLECEYPLFREGAHSVHLPPLGSE